MSDETDADAPQWRQTVEAFNHTMSELDSMRMQLRREVPNVANTSPEAVLDISGLAGHDEQIERIVSQTEHSPTPQSSTLNAARNEQIEKLERVLKVIRRVVGDREPTARERAALAEVDAELEALRQQWRDMQPRKT